MLKGRCEMMADIIITHIMVELFRNLLHVVFTYAMMQSYNRSKIVHSIIEREKEKVSE